MGREGRDVLNTDGRQESRLLAAAGRITGKNVRNAEKAQVPILRDGAGRKPREFVASKEPTYRRRLSSAAGSLTSRLLVWPSSPLFYLLGGKTDLVHLKQHSSLSET